VGSQWPDPIQIGPQVKKTIKASRCISGLDHPTPMRHCCNAPKSLLPPL